MQVDNRYSIKKYIKQYNLFLTPPSLEFTWIEYSEIFSCHFISARLSFTSFSTESVADLVCWIKHGGAITGNKDVNK